jgi:hypothetical protein
MFCISTRDLGLFDGKWREIMTAMIKCRESFSVFDHIPLEKDANA